MAFTQSIDCDNPPGAELALETLGALARLMLNPYIKKIVIHRKPYAHEKPISIGGLNRYDCSRQAGGHYYSIQLYLQHPWLDDYS